MKILLVPSTYLPSVGGVQLNTHQLAKNLWSLGHEVVVLTSKWGRWELPSHEELEGVPVYRTYFNVFKGSLRSLFAFSICLPTALLRTILIFRHFKPDIVNVHFIGANAFYIYLLRTIFDFPLIVTLCGMEPPSPSSVLCRYGYKPLEARIMNWLSLRILKKADLVTAVSQSLLNSALEQSKLDAEKFLKIPVGVDMQHFSSIIKTSGNKYLLGLGRLGFEKGFDILIRSLSLLNEECGSTHLIIAGDGPERTNLENLVKELGLQSRVKFFGMVDKKRVNELLSNCRFLVVPSRREGFGVVNIEAMASQKPVIGSRVGGIPEIIRHGQTGLLVKPEDPEDLARAMQYLISNPEIAERMGKKGRRLVEKHFTWKAIAQKYVRSYDNIITK